jgi:hypothetical protein
LQFQASPGKREKACETPSQWEKSWVQWPAPVIPVMAGNLT